MLTKIASLENDFELEVYEQHAVRGGGCSDWCPVKNDVEGFCCRNETGWNKYSAHYSS